MDLYAQNILDRYKNPLNKDKSFLPDISRKEANHSCGDSITVELNVTNETSKVENYSFSGAGCAISMAAADMLGDLIQDMNTEEILRITKQDIYEMLGIEISLRRSKCALLSLLALHNAILEKEGKGLRGWTDFTG